jgi:D-alanyl-D-alanine dipeptidase
MRLIQRVLPLAVAIGQLIVFAGTSAAADPGVPPVSDAAREAGFIDVRSVVPDAIIDLRYATTNNFTGIQLYPADARCLVSRTSGGRDGAAPPGARAGVLGLLPAA